jgi:hypothetical protein
MRREKKNHLKWKKASNLVLEVCQKVQNAFETISNQKEIWGKSLNTQIIMDIGALK